MEKIITYHLVKIMTGFLGQYLVIDGDMHYQNQWMNSLQLIIILKKT